MHKVFVYGTLRKGFHNHSILSGSKFLGSGKTKHMFRMTASAGIPFVSATSINGVTNIKGEAYEVSDSTLERLDQLEGHPAFYTRRQTIIDLGEKQEGFWMYFCEYKGEFKIPSGDFSDYWNQWPT